MKRGVIYGAIFFAITLLITYNYLETYNFIGDKKKSIVFSDLADGPDNLLSTAKEGYDQDYFGKSIYSIEKAIKLMKYFENDADVETIQEIEEAIRELRIVEREISKDSVNEEHLNHSFARALNSLAYTHVKILEDLAEHEDYEKIKTTLEYTIVHLHNAIKYSNGIMRNDELTLLSKLEEFLNSVKEHHKLDKQVIMSSIASLEQLIQKENQTSF